MARGEPSRPGRARPATRRLASVEQAGWPGACCPAARPSGKVTDARATAPDLVLNPEPSNPNSKSPRDKRITGHSAQSQLRRSGGRRPRKRGR